MGALISRFRKKPSTHEQLKSIEKSLKQIDEYKRITERKQKRTVANLIIYGAALYVLAIFIVFVWFLPENWLVRLGLLIPLVLVPAIIYWTKRLISTYFQSRMVKANEEYADLERKKQDIIDNVMETETYNKAKEILSKYAPDKLEKKLQEQGALVGTGELRKRTTGTNMTPPIGKPIPPLRATKNGQGNIQAFPSNLPPLSSAEQPKNYGPLIQMPQNLFPRERSFSDKLVEYIVGDGPGYRYALICQHCHGHNGMALKEEFPYLAYKCCYCHQFNAARKERPQAPKLPDPSPHLASLQPQTLNGSNDAENKNENKENIGPVGMVESGGEKKSNAGGDEDLSKSTGDEGMNQENNSEVLDEDDGMNPEKKSKELDDFDGNGKE